ncbi:MAG: ribonuclease PH [Eubacteriaceae bacterium]|nr:ribonuclease PH [Eubacteriaceae bacterium]
MREDGRANDVLREINITRNYTKYAQGSVLIAMGDTKVLCTATVEEKVPPFMRGSGGGWLSAEYAMLPASVAVRKQRDINRGRLDGRSAEIQRLIGRALRSVMDLKKLGERTIWIDCDVLQADGGTRTCAITGAYVALQDCIQYLLEQKIIDENPIRCAVAAVSVGIVEDEILLDLSYSEDSCAQADMNVVMTEEGEFCEIQATGEKRPITQGEMTAMLNVVQKAMVQLFEKIDGGE